MDDVNGVSFVQDLLSDGDLVMGTLRVAFVISKQGKEQYHVSIMGEDLSGWRVIGVLEDVKMSMLTQLQKDRGEFP